MSLDMNNPYQAHAVFALSFDCEACGRLMEFSSPYPEFTDSWYRDLAEQARAQKWFVPAADANGKMDVMSAWCSECAAKPGFHPKESGTKI
jgi:hypothetical protein